MCTCHFCFTVIFVMGHAQIAHALIPILLAGLQIHRHRLAEWQYSYLSLSAHAFAYTFVTHSCQATPCLVHLFARFI